MRSLSGLLFLKESLTSFLELPHFMRKRSNVFSVKQSLTLTLIGVSVTKASRKVFHFFSSCAGEALKHSHFMVIFGERVAKRRKKWSSCKHKLESANVKSKKLCLAERQVMWRGEAKTVWNNSSLPWPPSEKKFHPLPYAWDIKSGQAGTSTPAQLLSVSSFSLC